MMFDKNRRLIGIRPTISIQPHAFQIRQHSTGNYKRLSAAAFCRHHGLYFSGTLLFHNIRIDEKGIMMLDLVNATIVGRGAR